MSAVARNTEHERGEGRQRVLLGGRILFGGDFTCECTIRDLSPSGARVRLPASVTVPDSFTLIDLPHGQAYEAHVAWRRGDQVGVSFGVGQDLTGPVPPDLQRVRALWIAARFR